MKSKGEKERYKHLNAEFQRIARRDKKAFFTAGLDARPQPQPEPGPRDPRASAPPGLGSRLHLVFSRVKFSGPEA